MFCRIFSALLQSAFPTNLHDEQTYNPRCFRFNFVSSPHPEHVFEVFHTFSFSTSTPRISPL